MSDRRYASPAARRYARALFQLAQEKGALEAVAADMVLLSEITSHPEVSGWLSDPRVEDRPKQELLDKQLASRCHELTGSFLNLVSRRRRHSVLPEVPAAFRDLADEHEDRIRGLVETARPLGEGELHDLESALSRQTGKSVALEPREEPSLLGGVRITLGGVRYDGSARGRLENLGRNLVHADLGQPPSQAS